MGLPIKIELIPSGSLHSMAMANNINPGMSLLVPTFDTGTSMSMDIQQETSKPMVPQISDKDVSNEIKRPTYGRQG